MRPERPDPGQKPPQAPRSARRGWRSAALLATLVTFGMGLAACGGGSTNTSSNHASGCSVAGCSGPGASASAQAMALRFSGCMRSHGITDFPDPTIGSNGLPSWTLTHVAKAPALRAARRVCQKDLPNLVQTSAEKVTANAAALKYANCMRSNGVPDFPDPNGQGLIQIRNATGVLDPSSPQFQKAETACERLDDGFAQASGSSSQASGSSRPSWSFAHRVISRSRR